MAADIVEPAQASTRAQGRFVTSFFANVVALGVLYMLYSAVRQVTADSLRTARENADRLLAFQHWMGLPDEATVQGLLIDHHSLVRFANVYYLSMHFPSMVLFLLTVLVVRRPWMGRVRVAAVGSTMAGLVIHLLFPLAPPRMLSLDGFVDTAKAFGPDPYALGVANAANQFAAMPSMHVGWALLIAIGVVRIFRSRFRWLIVLHPLITTIVVVVTANHYWTDVAVGALLACMGWWIGGVLGLGPSSDGAVAVEPGVAVEPVPLSDRTGVAAADGEFQPA